MKFVGFEEPIFAVIVAVGIEPLLRAIGEDDLLGYIPRKCETEADRVVQAFFKNGNRSPKISGRKILLKGGGANDLIVQLDGGSRGRRCDFEGFCGEQTDAREEQQNAEKAARLKEK